ncbi:MAG: AlpA family phage regulatory protein [Burkholderiaceae bacterium]|nr:AlpA family phage regulatory protein [Burkholderiaceae bacterium]
MRILRVEQVADRIGGSRALVWRKAKEEADFPKPIKVTPGITGWLEHEVDAYIARRVVESRGAGAVTA